MGSGTNERSHTDNAGHGPQEAQARYDLRNALTVAQGYAQLLQRALRDGRRMDDIHLQDRLETIVAMTRRIESNLATLDAHDRSHT